MKQKITLVLAILCSLYSFGQVGTVFKSGSLKYKITAATTVEVGENSGIIGAITIPSTVSYNSVNYQVKSIGLGAFQNNLSLSSITIPSSVTSIGQSAFLFCSGLYSVSIPNSVTTIGAFAFQDCTRLTSLTIPNSVTSIGNSAFLNCSGLTSVSLGSAVTSIGNFAFSLCTSLTSVTIPNSVTSISNSAFSHCTSLTSVSLGSAVTSIGNFAFSETGLVSITIPNKVTSIGNNAFSRCSNLKSFVMGTSVATIGNTAFWYCTSLTSITIPNSVTNIGSNSFQSCSNLTSVTLGNSITSIGDFSFTGCTSLTSFTVNWTTPLTINANIFNGLNLSTKTLNVPAGRVAAYDAAAVWTDFNPIVEIVVLNQTFTSNGINYIVTKATLPYTVSVGSNTSFVGAATIPASVTNAGNSFAVTNIGTYAFRNCTGLTSVTIPNSVLFINESAFSLCTSLTSVSLGSAVIDIGRHAFSGCSSLSSITIPNSVTRIFGSAFSGCTGLTSVSIPNSVTSIANNAFSSCSVLTSVTIPNSVTSIEPGTFSNCTSLTSVTIPDSVTSIGEYAFGSCYVLTSVTIPNSVTSIGLGAFQNNLSLTSVTIPDSVTSIGEWAFGSCYALTSVAIPNTVESIGDYSFSSCTGLTSVTVNWTTPLRISSTVFSRLDLPNIILNVPAETAATYDAASIWTNFNPIVEPVIVSLYTAIPDTNFEQALFDLGIDTVNGDHQVLTSGVNELTSLDVSNTSITNLTGIEAFSSLTELNCSGNLLTNLSVNNLTGLEFLTCSNNQLTSLNTTNLTALTSLDCSNNLVSSLSLTTNTKLIWLQCQSNQITSLNLSGLVTLQTLWCSYNQLTSLNASGTDLRDLNCSNNYNETVEPFTYLTNINLTGLSNLSNLDCSGNVLLANLNFLGLSNLNFLDLSYNNFSTINLSSLTNLWQLDISNNKLTALDLSSNPISSFNSFSNLSLSCISVQDVALAENAGWSVDSWSTFKLPAASCLYTLIPDANFEQALIDLGHDNAIDGKVLTSSVTGIITLDVSNKSISYLNGIKSFTALQHLNCSSNGLNTLDIVGLSNLKTIDCSSNSIGEFLMTNTTNLTSLNCSFNSLESLNLSGLTNLNTLVCGSNQLTSLNFTGLTHLATLDCSNNSLPTLSYSGLTTLTSLDCSYTERTSLSLSGLTNLISLKFSDNFLTTISLSGLSNLKTLDCSNNKLSTISLSGLSLLETFSCGGNLLTSLSLSNMPTLKNLYCIGVHNTSFDGNVFSSTVTSLLTSLTLTGLSNLENLNCSENKLTTMSLSGLTSLKSLRCGNNNFSTLSLNATNFPSLIDLDCSGWVIGSKGNISSLDLIGFSNLKTLDCSQNLLSTFSLTGLTSLTSLTCGRNSFTSLNVNSTTFPALTYLDCNGWIYNQGLINSLNLTGLSNAVTVDCKGNPSLTCISVSDPVTAAANTNWSKDATASYSTNCNEASTGATAAVLSGSTAICSGNTANINIAITGGTSPYTVVYFNGVANATITGYVSGTAIPVSPTTTATYTIVSVTDAASNLGTGNSGTVVVTVNPNVTPPFTQVAPICNGAALAALPTTANNGVTGTWAPAIDNTATTTYTFTPDAGQCAIATTMTIVINPNPIVTFGANPFPVCVGTSTVLTAYASNLTPTVNFTDLSATNQSLSMIAAAFGVPVTSPLTGILALAPSDGCAAFTPGLFAGKIALIQRGTCSFAIKAQNAQDAGAIGVLIYNNAAGNLNIGGAAPTVTIPVYGITQADGLALIAAMTANEVSVTLAPSPTLTYVWSNGSLTQTTNTGVLNVDTDFSVTVTNPATGCSTLQTVTVPVTANTIPTFTQVAPICTGGTLAALPTTSDNGLVGTWAPALDNTATTTYTFTPTPVAGQCLGTATMTITVNQPSVPPFTQVAPICNGAVLAALPTTANNGITGTWGPAIDNTATTTYTFTPDAGQCAITTTMTIVVNPNPIVTFGANPFPVCVGTSTVLTAYASNLTPTVNFTDLSAVNQSLSIIPATFGVPVTSPLTGILALAPSDGCAAFAPGLFTGKIALIQRGTCYFNIKVQNAINAGAIGVIIYNNVADILNVGGTSDTATIPIYGTTQANGLALIAAMTANEVSVTLAPSPTLTYVWSNGSLTQTTNTGVLNVDTDFSVTVTNPATGCSTLQTVTVPVTANTIPTFTQVAPICTGGTLAALPTTSDNGLVGTWAPALDNTATTTYTFTPTPVAGQCLGTATMTITVNQPSAPPFTQVAPICNGAVLAALPTTANNGITGTWAPAIDNTATTTYTFTPTAGQCATTASMIITVTPNVLYYADIDGDGFGNPAVSQQSCTGALTGYVTNNTDCNDNNIAATTAIVISNQPVNATICKAIGGTASFTVATTAETGTYQWYAQAATATTWTALTNTANYSGATAATLNSIKTTATVPATGTKYKVVVTSSCGTLTSAIVTLTDLTVLSKAATIAVLSKLSPALTVCEGNSVNLSLAAGSVGNIQWQSSTDGIAYSNVGALIAQSALSATNAAMPFNSDALTQTTWFRVVASNGVCSSVNGTPIKITVSSAAVAGKISGGDVTVCAPLTTGIDANGNALTTAITNSTSLSLGDYTQGATIVWQKSTNYSAAIPTWAAAGSTTNTFTATALTADTWYRALVTNGACKATTAVTKIKVDKAAKAGTNTSTTNGVATASVCTGGDITFTSAAYTGTAIQWEVSTTSATTGFVPIEGATAASFTINNIGYAALSKFYVRSVVTSGACTLARSAVKTITVNPTSVGGTASGGGIICSGSNGTLKVSGNTGTIQWQSSANGTDFVNVPSIVGTAGTNYVSGSATGTAATYLVTAITTDTYFRAKITSGACSVTFSNVIQYAIGAAAASGTLTTAKETVCKGTETTLTLTGSVGTIKWLKSTNWTTASPTWTAVTTSTTGTLATGNLTASTAYKAEASIGSCSTATSQVVPVLVYAAPLAKTITATVSSPTGATSLLAICTTSSISKVLTIGAGSNGAIQWQKSTTSTTTGFTDIPNAAATSYTIANPAVGVNYYRAKFTNSCGLSVYSAAFTVYYKNCSVIAKMTEAKVVPAAAVVPFEVLAYPNPFTSTFNLELITTSSENVQVNVYDAIGKLVETRNVPVSEVGNKEVGSNYPTGVYNITISQGTEMKTLRVMKKY